jgi:hypothetical protein
MKRRLLSHVIVLVAGGGIGFILGNKSNHAVLMQSIAERASIQAAVDNMIQTLNLKPNASGDKFNHEFTAALLGRNQAMNPANLIFLTLAESKIQDGKIISAIGLPLEFKPVSSGVDQTAINVTFGTNFLTSKR